MGFVAMLCNATFTPSSQSPSTASWSLSAPLQSASTVSSPVAAPSSKIASSLQSPSTASWSLSAPLQSASTVSSPVAAPSSKTASSLKVPSPKVYSPAISNTSQAANVPSLVPISRTNSNAWRISLNVFESTLGMRDSVRTALIEWFINDIAKDQVHHGPIL